MHPLVENTLRKAVASGAVLDFVSDFEAVAELERLAIAIDTVPAEERLALLRAPVEVGGIYLRRLSLAALEWLTCRVFPWFQTEPELKDLATAYAMANIKTPAKFLRIIRRKDAVRELWRFAMEIKASHDELAAAMNLLLESPMKIAHRSEAAKAARASGYGPIVATLIDRHGGSPDYWMFEVPDGFVLYILAHGDRLASARPIPGRAPDPEGWHAQATIRYQRAARAFLASVKPAQKEAAA